MLVERSIDANLIVYVDVIVNQVEYQHEVKIITKENKSFSGQNQRSCVTVLQAQVRLNT